MPNLNECYRTLELRVGASLEEVNEAYKDLVFIWHPDRIPQSRERLQQKAIVKLQDLNKARDYLQSYLQRRQNLRSARRPAQKAAAAGQARSASSPAPAKTTRRTAPPRTTQKPKERQSQAAQKFRQRTKATQPHPDLFPILRRKRLLRPKVSLLSHLLRPILLLSELLNDGAQVERQSLLKQLLQQPSLPRVL